MFKSVNIGRLEAGGSAATSRSAACSAAYPGLQTTDLGVRGSNPFGRAKSSPDVCASSERPTASVGVRRNESHGHTARRQVALVAGATRGAGRGIAVQLGAAGATVYVTGRTTRSQRSEMNRAETIEQTAALVDEAGGHGIAVQVDHLVPDAVRALVARIECEQDSLHLLVNNIWGAPIEWNKSVWESSLETGLRRCAWAWRRTPSPATARSRC